MVVPIFEYIRVSIISFRPGDVDETKLSTSSRGFSHLIVARRVWDRRSSRSSVQPDTLIWRLIGSRVKHNVDMRRTKPFQQHHTRHALSSVIFSSIGEFIESARVGPTLRMRTGFEDQAGGPGVLPIDVRNAQEKELRRGSHDKITSSTELWEAVQ